MRIVRPFKVTPTALVATDIAEDEYPAWSSMTPYTLDQRVLYQSKVYQCTQAGTNKNPEIEKSYWVFVKASNRWSIFDAVISTYTTKPTSFTYTVQCTGTVNSIAFLDVTATTIRVVVEDASLGVVYDETFDMLANSGIQDWYSYFFEPITRLKDKTILSLPSYLNPKITFTVTNSGGVASVGEVVMGMQRYIGRTQYGSSVGIIDYSKKEKDQFGAYRVVERPYSKRGSFNVMVDNSFIDELQTLLASYRSIPILYLGTDCYEATSVYGFYKDFTLVIQHTSETQCNIEVEGLT